MAHKDKLDLVIDRIDDLKDSTESRLDSIDFNLAEHMRRTDILEELHRDNQKKIELQQQDIETLKEPQKAMHFIKRVVVYVGVVSAGIVSVVKLLEYLP